MQFRRWIEGVVLVVACGSFAAVGCSDDGGSAGGGGGATGHGTGLGGTPAATDTNPANPHVTTTPPASPNGPAVSKPAGGSGGNGAAGATGNAGRSGTAGQTGTGTAGQTGTGTAGAGSAGNPGTVTTGTAGTTGGGASGGLSTGGVDAGAPIPQTWPTVDCVGGPCGPPGVCVNLDFLFVACAVCGGEDQVCCPPYATDNPFHGTCAPGLICAANPNFQSDPPLDVVKEVCQIPGSPPAATGGLNHQRLLIAP